MRNIRQNLVFALIQREHTNSCDLTPDG